MNTQLFRFQHSYRFARHRKILAACLFATCALVAACFVGLAYDWVETHEFMARMTQDAQIAQAQQRTVAETISAMRADKLKWGIVCAE